MGSRTQVRINLKGELNLFFLRVSVFLPGKGKVHLIYMDTQERYKGPDSPSLQLLSDV